MTNEYNKEVSRALTIAKEAAKGSIFVFTGNTLSTIILAIASIIIARLLGPSDYGLYSIALIIPYLMILFTDFGINPALVRFITKFRSEGKSKSIGNLIKTGFLFETSISILTFILTFLLADILAIYLLNRSNIGFLIRLASLTIIGNMLIITSNNIFVGLDKMDKMALISIAQAIIKAFLAPILIIFGFSIIGALIGHILGYLIAGIIGAIIIIKISKLTIYNSNDNSSYTNNLTLMIKYGMPLYISTLIGGLLNQYRSIILTWFTSNIEIGNYYVATIFSTIITLLTIPISTTLFPAFSKLDPNNETKELNMLFTYSLKYTLFLTIPATIFIAIFSNILVTFFYGSNYTQAPYYLTIYSITFFYTSFSLVLANLFNGIGRTDLSLKAILIQLPFTFILTPILTLFYKVEGFIFALIVSSILSLAYLIFNAYNKYNLKFDLKNIIKIFIISFISSILSFALISYFQFSYLIKLIIATIIFLISYMSLAPIAIINQEDIINLTLIIENIPLSKFFKIILSYEEKIFSFIKSI